MDNYSFRRFFSLSGKKKVTFWPGNAVTNDFSTPNPVESKSFLGTATHHLFVKFLQDAKIPTYEIPNRQFHPLEKGTTNRQNGVTTRKKKMSRGSFGEKKRPLIQVFWSYDHLPRMSGDIFCLCAFHVLKTLQLDYAAEKLTQLRCRKQIRDFSILCFFLQIKFCVSLKLYNFNAKFTLCVTPEN